MFSSPCVLLLNMAFKYECFSVACLRDDRVLGMTVRAAQKFIFRENTFVISMGVSYVQRLTWCLCYFVLHGSKPVSVLYWAHNALGL